jgi:hypothetical protein
MDENNLEETSTNEEQSSLSNSSKCYTKPKPSIQEHYYTPPPNLVLLLDQDRTDRIEDLFHH